MFDNGPVFIEVKGGWINPEDIFWVQTSRNDEKRLVVGLPGMEKPVNLSEEDSATLRKYLEEHTWRPDENENFILEEGEVEDAV